jgi:hypothetical protein
MVERSPGHASAAASRWPWQWLCGLGVVGFFYWSLVSANAASAYVEFEHEVESLETAVAIGAVAAAHPVAPSPSASTMLAAAPAQLTAAALELRARFALLQSRHSADDRQYRLWLRRARDDLRVATARRPQWPYAWAALAEVKATQASFDAEFALAFVHAMQTGPYEARASRRLLGIVLSHSNRMRAADWRAAEVLARRLAKAQPALLVERVERDQQMNWLCGIADLPVTVQNACARHRASLPPQETL